MMQNLMLMTAMAKTKLHKLLSDERGGATIVTMVVLIGIAVSLALIFKTQIQELLESLFKTIIDVTNQSVQGG